jgi:hypothetical protein
MPVKYIQFKGKTILYVDYRNMTGDEGIATLDEEAIEVRKWTQPGLILSDFHNAKGSTGFMAHAKKLGKEIFAEKTLKAAAIGITGIQNVLLQAYNTFSTDKLVPFATEEEAKEWLIKED